MSTAALNPNNTVLETSAHALTPTTTSWNPKPRIIEFYGYEGEDFRYFKSILETFFSLTGVTSEPRRVTILRTQLRRAAAVFFDQALKKRRLTLATITYPDAMQLLQEHYITDRLIQNYELAFNEMVQSQNESPQVFLSRLYEAADLADITDEKYIHSRYRAGLIPPIKIFCREQSSDTFEQWVKHADGWWNAHAPQSINLVENPFISHGLEAHRSVPLNDTLPLGVGGKNKAISSTVVTGTGQSSVKAYSVEESPTIAALTAKLEALDLHQLIPYVEAKSILAAGSQRESSYHNNNNTDVKSLLKKVVNEVMADEFNNRKEGSSNFNDSYGNINNGFNGGSYGSSKRSERKAKKSAYRKNAAPWWEDPRAHDPNWFFDNDHYSPMEGHWVRVNPPHDAPPPSSYRYGNQHHSGYNSNYAPNNYSNNHNRSSYGNYSQNNRNNNQGDNGYYDGYNSRGQENSQTRYGNNNNAHSYGQNYGPSYGQGYNAQGQGDGPGQGYGSRQGYGNNGQQGYGQRQNFGNNGQSQGQRNYGSQQQHRQQDYSNNNRNNQAPSGNHSKN